MKKHSTDYYDWIDEVGPEILKNLNEILAAKGIDPLRDLHGGMFKDGKWVGIMDGSDYRNYWHAYIAMWGDDLRNDSYQTMNFPHPDSDEDWDFYIKKLRQDSAEDRSHVHSDPNWTDDLVTALKKTIKENFEPDKYGEYSVVFWWCW